MNENLKKILSQKAKIHIDRYLKKYNKFEYLEWWLLKDILTNTIKKNNLASDLNDFDIDQQLENLIEYLKKTYSNTHLIRKEKKLYQAKYYQNKTRQGNEMTGREKALNTAKIKRAKSFNLVSDAYAKLIKLNQKTTIKNILVLINNELSKAQVSRYLKEIKDANKNIVDCKNMSLEEIEEIINR